MKGGTVQINWHDTKPVLTQDFHPISGTLTTGGANFDIESFSALAADTPWDSGTTWSTMDFYTLTLHIPLSFGWIYVVTQILQQPVLDPNTKAISLLIAQTLELISTLILLKYTAKPQHNFFNFFKGCSLSKERNCLLASAIGFGFLFTLVLSTSFFANGLLEPKLVKVFALLCQKQGRFISVPDTWAPPEVKPYTPGENLQQWLTDEKARNQFVIRASTDTKLLWNDTRQLKADPVYKRARIAIAYLVAALCEIWLRGDNNVNSGSSLLKNYRFQWAVSLILSSIYLALLYGLKVPDWEYHIPIENSTSPASTSFLVKCGVRGDTRLACNAVGMIDRKILGIQHLYRKPVYARSEQCSINSPNFGPLSMDAPSWCQAPFDPEGLLSSVMAIVTCLIGLHFGHIIVHFKVRNIVFMLCHLIFISCLPELSFTSYAFELMDARSQEHNPPMDDPVFRPSNLRPCLGPVWDACENKPLYSLSYMCVTYATAGILFVVIYLLVFVKGEYYVEDIDEMRKE